MRQRLAAGEQVVRMYREPAWAWLERQAEAAEQLLAERPTVGAEVRRSGRIFQKRAKRTSGS